MKNKTI